METYNFGHTILAHASFTINLEIISTKIMEQDLTLIIASK